jgi:AAHS family 4-hydroxybenzoate transporter-like MFS transporter
MSSRGNTVNLSELIDSRPLSGLQIRTVALCALVAVLDGIDAQSIAVAAPSIAASLGLKTSTLGQVFAAATLGAMIGALSFGPLADWLGRKRVLIAAISLFASFTLATALAGSYEALLACRFAAGIGLGGALPCFLALASEYAPKRARGAMVSLLWAGFPLGGMLGGFLNSMIITEFGWQSVFYIGGALPLLVAVVLAVALPESLQFLALHERGQARIRRIGARLAPGDSGIGPETRFVTQEERLTGVPVKHLFLEGRALGTLLLWVPFFMAFGVLGAVVYWIPALLHEAGLPPAAGGIVLGFHGLGAVIGMSIAGKLIDRFGAARVLLPAFVVGAVCTAALGLMSSSTALAATAMGAIGVFVGMSGSGCIALAAIVYPAAVRSSGIGWAMGAGRFGQVVAPLLIGSMLDWGWGAERMMAMLGIGLAIAALFVALLALNATRGRAVAPHGAVGQTLPRP